MPLDCTFKMIKMKILCYACFNNLQYHWIVYFKWVNFMVCELHLTLRLLKKKKTLKKKSIGHGVLLCSSGSSCPVTQALTSLFTHALTLSWLTRSTKGPGVGGEVAESPLQKSQGILWLDKMWGPVKREDWEGLWVGSGRTRTWDGASTK